MNYLYIYYDNENKLNFLKIYNNILYLDNGENNILNDDFVKKTVNESNFQYINGYIENYTEDFIINILTNNNIYFLLKIKKDLSVRIKLESKSGYISEICGESLNR